MEVNGYRIAPRANLVRVYLGFTDLRNADLRNAKLNGADLTDANLSNADLSPTGEIRGTGFGDRAGPGVGRVAAGNTNLTGANLQGANLAGAIMPDGSIHD
jgi:uncharacterized protein YjbI with pentapeptide repeats